MTGPDLHKALKTLGWSRADLSRRVKVDPNTVSKWIVGKSPIPGAVEAYLRLATDVQNLSAAVVKVVL